MRTKTEIKLFMLLLPSIVGLFVFFVAPFVVSIYSAFIDNPITANYIGFKNFLDVLSGLAFRLALGNTLIFLFASIPLNILIPLFLAILINKSPKKNFFAVIFLLPIVIPSGSTVFFWQSIFGINGVLNSLLFQDNPINWVDTSFSRGIVLLIFIWKNAGFNMVLFLAGLNLIPKQYYETASMEGANSWHKFSRITIIYLIPTFFTTFLMSFINSFKAFKEIYILYGLYPNKYIYMLQHFMYNQFRTVKYQHLASSAYILTIGFVVIIFIFFRLQNKMNEKF